jgi:hypothetical protein
MSAYSNMKGGLGKITKPQVNFQKVMDEIHFATQLKRENLTEDRNSIVHKCYDMQRKAQVEKEQSGFSNRSSIAELSQALTKIRESMYQRAKNQAYA